MANIVRKPINLQDLDEQTLKEMAGVEEFTDQDRGEIDRIYEIVGGDRRLCRKADGTDDLRGVTIQEFVRLTRKWGLLITALMEARRIQLTLLIDTAMFNAAEALVGRDLISSISPDKLARTMESIGNMRQRDSERYSNSGLIGDGARADSKEKADQSRELLFKYLSTNPKLRDDFIKRALEEETNKLAIIDVDGDAIN